MDRKSFFKPFLGLQGLQKSNTVQASNSDGSSDTSMSSKSSLPIDLTDTDSTHDRSPSPTGIKATPSSSVPSSSVPIPLRNNRSNGGAGSGGGGGGAIQSKSLSSSVGSPCVVTVTTLCSGTPRNLVSSHSGNITLAVALQEPAVFLACAPRSSTSYSEFDGGEAPSASSAPPPSTSSSSSTGLGLSGDSDDRDQDNEHSHGFLNGIRRSYTQNQGAGQGLASEISRVFSNSSELSNASGPGPSPGPTPAADSLDSSDLLDGLDADSDGLGGQAGSGETGSGETFTLTNSCSSGLTPSMLRGSVVLKVTKPTKIKGLNLNFYGISRTVWSEVRSDSMVDDSNLHAPTDFFDNYYINVHRWEFLPSSSLAKINKKSLESLDHSCTLVGTDLYGADNAVLKSDLSNVHTKNASESRIINYNGKHITSDDLPIFKPNGCSRRKLNLPSVFSNKDAFMLPAGEYVYNFNLAIDAAVPESISLPNGSIEYVLQAKVIRSGTFAPNIGGHQSIPLIRSPPDNSEGQQFNNPLAIAKNWEGRLQYEINLPQKYIPLGTKVPFSIKLMPIDKIMVHRVRVFICEQIEHKSTLDHSLRQSDRPLKLLLFERKGRTKRVVINSKGETREKLVGNLLTDSKDGAEHGDDVESEAQSVKTVISGELPLLSSSSDFSVIPWQYVDSANNVRFLRPDHYSSPYLRVKHRLIFALRMSKQDSGESRRRHYEVKIDTPVTLLAKMCSQGSVNLPLYSESVPNGSVSWTPMDDNADVHSDEVPLDYTMSNTSEFINSPPTFDDALADITRNISRSHFTDAPPPDYSSSVGA